MQMIGGVAAVERSAVLVPELADRRVQLTFAGFGGERELDVYGVLFDRPGITAGFPVVACAVPFSMVERVLIGAQVNSVEILEGIAYKEHQRHRRVTTRLREIVTGEGVVFAYLHLIDPWFDILVALTFLDTGKLRSCRVRTRQTEVGLVIQTVVEEMQGVSYAQHAEERVVIDTSYAHGRFQRVRVLSAAHHTVAVEDSLELILEELVSGRRLFLR